MISLTFMFTASMLWSGKLLQQSLKYSRKQNSIPKEALKVKTLVFQEIHTRPCCLLRDILVLNALSKLKQSRCLRWLGDTKSRLSHHSYFLGKVGSTLMCILLCVRFKQCYRRPSLTLKIALTQTCPLKSGGSGVSLALPS